MSRCWYKPCRILPEILRVSQRKTKESSSVLAHFSVKFNRIHRRVLSNQLLSSCPWEFPPSLLQALTRADNRARYRSNPSRPVDLLPTSRTYKEHQAHLQRSGQVPVRQDQDPVQQGREELQRVLNKENADTMAPMTRGGRATTPATTVTPATTGRTITNPANPLDTEDTGDTVSITQCRVRKFQFFTG